MGRFRNSHRRALEYIENHPGLLHIENVIARTIEMKLCDKKEKLLTKVDVVFFLTGDRVAVVEYKNGDKIQQVKKAESQLQIAFKWFTKEKYKPTCYFVDSKRYPEIYENMRHPRTQRYNGTRQRGTLQNGT